eukprot:GHVP01042533.1.p2 GENE.GHVP01042533.1~~GHVP01042533.1.p2  ORF type:complete len:432 (-),score=84.25 GHVP01042533.1:5075-6370(-)
MYPRRSARQEARRAEISKENDSEEENMLEKTKTTPKKKGKKPTKLITQKVETVLLEDVLKELSLEVPVEVLHREHELSELLEQIHTFLRNWVGRPVYLSGMPGTGKTAIVRKALESIQSQENSYVQIVFLNAQSFSNPYSVYSVILKVLEPKYRRVDGKKAMTQVKVSLKSKSKKNRVILIVDEIDKLIRKNQSIMYNLLELLGPKLMLITISNTMALLERLAPKIASRMGYASIQFLPYSETQLHQILKRRLESIKGLDFQTQALTYLAKTVASQTGDMRRALALARRAVEMSYNSRLEDGPDSFLQIRMTHVAQASKELFGWDFAGWIPNLSKIQKQFLYCVVLESRRLSDQEGIAALPRFTKIQRRLKTMQIEEKNLGSFVTKERCLRLVNMFAESGLVLTYYIAAEDEFAVALPEEIIDAVENEVKP